MAPKRLTAALTAAALACALSIAQAEKSAGNMVDDSVLTGSVKSELIGSKVVSANDINVEVYKGHVQLAGFVKSAAAKAEAVKLAKQVSGAQQVMDRMIVIEGKRSMGETMDDGVISTKLKTALLEAEGLGKGLDINTEVRRGEVLLSGFVPSADHKKKAGEVAKSVEGVTKVHNFIDLKPKE
jgi:hyperosmotically inducible protein